jgi:hypothetical protein
VDTPNDAVRAHSIQRIRTVPEELSWGDAQQLSSNCDQVTSRVVADVDNIERVAEAAMNTSSSQTIKHLAAAAPTR